MEDKITPHDLENGFSIILKNESNRKPIQITIFIIALGIAMFLLVSSAMVSLWLSLWFLLVFILPASLFYIGAMPAAKVIVNKNTVEFNFIIGIFNRKINRNRIKIENSNNKFHKQAIKISGRFILTRYYSMKYYSINKSESKS
jgi:hypothetical protein